MNWHLIYGVYIDHEPRKITILTTLSLKRDATLNLSPFFYKLVDPLHNRIIRILSDSVRYTLTQ